MTIRFRDAEIPCLGQTVEIRREKKYTALHTPQGEPVTGENGDLAVQVSGQGVLYGDDCDRIERIEEAFLQGGAGSLVVGNVEMEAYFTRLVRGVRSGEKLPYAFTFLQACGG